MSNNNTWPKDVGILAIELIFPAQYVDQTELEQHDGVSQGKYTIGLGQQKMGFCTDREDINSLCLTVVQRLIEKNHLDCAQIGRLEVGTETIIDKSKSVKTVLMQLFDGITDIEGIDTTNACYGGTAALFNALAWIESSAWNGRLAIVVAADIAVYAKGAARPTGGAGAVAMLIGPGAPLVVDRGARATYMKHAYDFYKPDLTSEYPVVDGKLSIECYLSALDNCYQLYRKNVKELSRDDSNKDLLHYFDAVLFHTPYCKLVQKSLARLALNDFIAAPETMRSPDLNKRFANVTLPGTYFDRDVEQAFVAHSKEQFITKTAPSLLVASQVGNMYTPSLYGGLVSLLISKPVTDLTGNHIALFAYGSGLAASLFSITVTDDPVALAKLIGNLDDVKGRLEQRVKISPAMFEATLELRRQNCHQVPYEPCEGDDLEHLFPGSYYLTRIDKLHRRFYARIPPATTTTTTNGFV